MDIHTATRHQEAGQRLPITVRLQRRRLALPPEAQRTVATGRQRAELFPEAVAVAVLSLVAAGVEPPRLLVDRVALVQPMSGMDTQPEARPIQLRLRQPTTFYTKPRMELG